ncbi:hypothetical protein [Actinomadura macrotermitis]|uniref:Uncharacterized protein n=1 Tax=Actinomadura macrotermitis TaxID=2585200 RepID=A0A7K0C169_9ACTN|nr:hypothetical protein [Actinomadura macrotermitis]MQY07179.1 hypothetical protein [Actinomadura macrotermitis]
MDDLDRIAGLHAAERPPSPATTAAARARLLAEARPAVRRPGPMAPRTRVAVAAFLAAAVVATAWGLYAWRTRPLYGVEPLAGQSGPAARFLLAAADGRARNPSDGEVWYRRSTVGGTVLVTSPYRPGVRYAMEVEQDDYTLTVAHGTLPRRRFSHAATSRGWQGRRIDVRPATPVDRTIWKADLRPDAATLGVNAPERAIGPEMGNGPVLDFGDEDARKLPADPAKLRAWLLNYATQFDHQRLPDPDRYLFGSASFLLVDAPVSDAVRIATYRVLASLKGVQAITATDAAGRISKGVAMRETTPENGTVELQLLVDARTGRLTASQTVIITPGSRNAGLRPGSRWFYEIVRQAEWTRTPPEKLLPKPDEEDDNVERGMVEISPPSE